MLAFAGEKRRSLPTSAAFAPETLPKPDEKQNSRPDFSSTKLTISEVYGEFSFRPPGCRLSPHWPKGVCLNAISPRYFVFL
jgi:hypothetical protein